ncbi:hypothetical protein VULLAG_LOCUS15872 [Vulpes lagopus]
MGQSPEAEGLHQNEALWRSLVRPRRQQVLDLESCKIHGDTSLQPTGSAPASVSSPTAGVPSGALAVGKG